MDVDKGIMLGVDIALKKAEHKAIFGTISGSAFKTIQPKDKQVEKIIIDLVRKPLSDIDSNNRNVKELTEIIDNIWEWSNTDNYIKSDGYEIKKLNKHKNDIHTNNSKLQT